MLVIIDGDPIRVDIGTTRLQKIVNTNWDLFLDKQSSRYYLRDDQSWLSAKALNDSWVPVTQVPAEFSKLLLSDLYRYCNRPASKRILVVNQPSELIVLAGNPVLAPIAGTRLMWVANTECDLFFDTAARQFYPHFGRWFSAWELKSNA